MREAIYPFTPGHRGVDTSAFAADAVETSVGFHMPSVRRIIRASQTFAVVSCATLEPVYDAMAFAASTARKNALLIETQPEFEVEWVELIRKLAPSRRLTIATVKGSEGTA